jgi:hypothetical protein
MIILERGHWAWPFEQCRPDEQCSPALKLGPGPTGKGPTRTMTLCLSNCEHVRAFTHRGLDHPALSTPTYRAHAVDTTSDRRARSLLHVATAPHVLLCSTSPVRL